MIGSVRFVVLERINLQKATNYADNHPVYKRKAQHPNRLTRNRLIVPHNIKLRPALPGMHSCPTYSLLNLGTSELRTR